MALHLKLTLPDYRNFISIEDSRTPEPIAAGLSKSISIDDSPPDNDNYAHAGAYYTLVTRQPSDECSVGKYPQSCGLIFILKPPV